MKERSELDEDEQIVAQLLDPAIVMKSLEDMENAFSDILQSFPSLFDLSMARSNLTKIRLVLLVFYCLREIFIKKYAFSVLPTSVVGMWLF